MPELFPRGGSLSSLSGSKRSSTSDALFGEKRLKRMEVAMKPRVKQLVRRSNVNKVKIPNNSTSMSTLVNLSSIGLGMAKTSDSGKNITIDKLVIKKYIPGCEAMGYVFKVFSNHAYISLPGGLTGVVDAEEVSEYLHKLKNESIDLNQVQYAINFCNMKFNLFNYS